MTSVAMGRPLIAAIATRPAHFGTINTIVSLAVPAALIPVTVAYARHSARALASGS